MISETVVNNISFTRYRVPGITEVVRDLVEIKGSSPVVRRRLCPRNTPEILINLGDPVYAEGVEREFTRCIIQGSKADPVDVVHSPCRHFLSIRFRPNGYYKVWGIPQCDFTNRYYQGGEVLEGLEELRNHLLECGSQEERFDLTSEWIRGEIAAADPRPESLLSDVLISALRRQPSLSVRELTRRTGYTRKHLGARFKEEAGMTVKRYQGIQRFYRMMKDLESEEHPQWARLACRHGYYDQSHFIREFKRYTGLTPTEYRRHGLAGLGR